MIKELLMLESLNFGKKIHPPEQLVQVLSPLQVQVCLGKTPEILNSLVYLSFTGNI
jgi:hypothetical protein